MCASFNLVAYAAVKGEGRPAHNICSGPDHGPCCPSHGPCRASKQGLGLDGLLDVCLDGPGSRRQGKSNGWHLLGREGGEREAQHLTKLSPPGFPGSLVVIQQGAGDTTWKDARWQGDQAGADEAVGAVRCGNGKDTVRGPGRRGAPVQRSQNWRCFFQRSFKDPTCDASKTGSSGSAAAGTTQQLRDSSTKVDDH